MQCSLRFVAQLTNMRSRSTVVLVRGVSVVSFSSWFPAIPLTHRLSDFGGPLLTYPSNTPFSVKKGSANHEVMVDSPSTRTHARVSGPASPMRKSILLLLATFC